MGYYYYEWRVIDDSRCEPWVRTYHIFETRGEAERAVQKLMEINHKGIEYRIRVVGA